MNDFRRNRKTLKLWGPGYRVYYAQAGQRLILLLAGGDKRKQQADIATALERWRDWQQQRKRS